MKFIDHSKGHLSAKLVVVHEDGNQTWLDYDTRGQTEEPDGVIMVFNSETGQYEEMENLAAAQDRFRDHYIRLVELLPDGNNNYDRKQRFAKQGKRLRNSTPFVISQSADL